MERSKIIETAQQFALRGQIPKAIEEWKKLLTDSVADASIYNTLGDLHLRNRSVTDSIDAYLSAGGIFHQSGFTAKAIAVYQKVLKIDPNRKDVHLRLADMNVERGMLGNAREQYLKAARLFTQEGMIRESLDIFRKIADLDPDNLSVRLKIAEACIKEGLQGEAIEEYLKIAEAYAKKGQTEDAEGLYHQILGLDPRNARALLALGRIHLQGNHPDATISYAEKVLEEHPQSADARVLLREAFLRLSQLDKAEGMARELVVLDPENLSYHQDLAQIALRRDDTQSAIESLTIVGRTHLKAGDYQKTIDCLKPVLQMVSLPESTLELLFQSHVGLAQKDAIVSWGIRLGSEYVRLEKQDKAIQIYTKVLEWDPRDPEALSLLRELQPASAETGPIEATHETPRGTIQQQLNSIGEVTDSPSERLSERMDAASVYLKYGLFEKAEKELLDALTIDPEDERVHLRLRELYRDASLQERLVATCLRLSEIYASRGDRRQEMTVLRQVIEADPENERAVLRLRELEFLTSRRDPGPVTPPRVVNLEELWEEALFYNQQGMFEEALVACQKLLTIQPDDPNALALIEKLRPTSSNAGLTNVTHGSIEPPGIAEEEVSYIQSGSGFFDLESALQEETRAPDPAVSNAGRSFDEIFQEFQEGIRSQFSDEDYETHYNLGIAYKEMGLLDEAVAEFQISSKSDDRYFDSVHMMAQCLRESGRSQQTIDILDQAIANPRYVDARHRILRYEKALSLEDLDLHKALGIYHEIYRMDPTFMDVAERLRRLEKQNLPE